MTPFVCGGPQALWASTRESLPVLPPRLLASIAATCSTFQVLPPYECNTGSSGGGSSSSSTYLEMFCERTCGLLPSFTAQQVRAGPPTPVRAKPTNREACARCLGACTRPRKPG